MSAVVLDVLREVLAAPGTAMDQFSVDSNPGLVRPSRGEWTQDLGRGVVSGLRRSTGSGNRCSDLVASRLS